MLSKIVEEFIDKAAGLRVAVVGETITDEFVYVIYEGQSMKSICPVFKMTGHREIQEGGAAAIANHLRDFVKEVDLISNRPDQVVKTRYVDTADRKKHVEINRFEIQNGQHIKVNVKDYDIVIVADFGHGFCNGLEINEGFHLMCQTNSNNFGFNRISKWKTYRKKSVCIDLREASLQMNRKMKFNDVHEVEQLFKYEVNSDKLFITLGHEGSLFYDGIEMIRHPSFKSEIVDTIGAGDTYYAFSCVASYFYTDEKILVVPSLAASLSTTWLCNEKSVTKKSLLDHAAKTV